MSPRVTYVKQQLVAKGFDKAVVNALFNDKRLRFYTIKTVTYKQPSWDIITKKLTSDTLVQNGRNYLVSHSAIFEKTERDYGVPQEILAGIIAIETDFGKNNGNYITFNALYSRMRQWSATRWKGQAEQVIALVTYCLEARIDCFSIKGSYAGALGIVQFMPNSLLAYGVDGDKNGTINLFEPEDAIPSAANFLIRHGWNDDQHKAITRYYGSSVGYPDIVLAYASLVKN